MVKDLRTGDETGNTSAVLDGGLDDFMAAALSASIEGGATKRSK
jgi:peptide chain release factor 2